MPAPTRLPRLVTGYTPLDQWIDTIVSAIERALNVSASNGIAARRSPSGINFTLENISQLALAFNGGGSISARSGSVPGSGTATVYKSFNPGNAPLAGVSDTVYNLGGTSIATSTWMIVGRCYGYWFVVVEVCS